MFLFLIELSGEWEAFQYLQTRFTVENAQQSLVCDEQRHGNESSAGDHV